MNHNAIKKEVLIAHYNSGKTVKELADLYNVKRQTVYQWFVKYSIPVHKKIKDDYIDLKQTLNKTELEELLKKHKIDEIAVSYNTKPHIISKLKKEYGIGRISVVERYRKQIMHYYVVDKLNTHEIAAKIGKSPTTVFRYMNMLDMPRRKK